MIYKTTKYQYEEVRKEIKKFTKKLDKYGFLWDFEPLGEHPEEVTVFAVDPADGHTLYEKDKYLTTVVEFDFTCEVLRLGDYIPVACIKHGDFVNEDGETINKVYPLKSEYEIPDDWYFLEARCEHCKVNRPRKTTYMLLDTNVGKYIQVGSTCVDEFLGISALDILRAYHFFNEIIEKAETLTEPMLSQVEAHDNTKYVHTVSYLAHCIERVDHCGYKKYDRYSQDSVDRWEDSTKADAFDRCFKKMPIDVEYMVKAQNIIDDFQRAYELPEYKGHFYQEIADALKQTYSEVDGRIAYAPVAHEKLLEDLKEEELKKLAAEQSSHYGEVGDKVDLKLTLIAKRGFDTQFGWTNVYTFVDADGKQFVWFTGKELEVSEIPMQVKGTIKEHSEYDGIKQTILTRCKIS